MRRTAAALIGILMAALPLAPARATDASGAVRAAVENFVRPAYDAFRQRAETLAASAEALCAKPSPQALDAARAAFRDTALAWNRAEAIRFGPVTEANRLERVLFFPDRKGLGSRQVQAALAAKDPAAADPKALATKSVATQGLPALEFLLWGGGADELASAEPQSFRCRYARAVAINLAGIAQDLDRAWDDPHGFAAQWEAPGPANPLFRDRDEALAQVVRTLVEGLEWLRDQRLGGFLAEQPPQDRPRQALFWRSGLTLASIEANLEGLSDFWAAAGLGKTLPGDSAWIEDSIRFEFANAKQAAGGLAGKPVEQILADPASRKRLGYLALVTSSLSDIVANRLSPALDLSAGFSSLDGD